MCSRLRENPRRLLECWCEVVGPQEAGGGRGPWISHKFPSSYNDEEVLKSVPMFAFPCSFENSTIQHFSFVLTSLDSKWTYGFCRHAPGSQTALVLLSHLPWHETFYKLLNHLAELRASNNTGDLTSCLQSVYRSAVPPPGSEITIPYGANKFFVGHCPDHHKLPTIPENRNLLEYYNAVDVENMVAIFASMLYERRIIITSRRVSRLSACVQAANLLLYPMQWQHIFIPVLPQHLTDYLLAPMPFLIGVGTSLLSKVQMDDVGEAVILDADANTVSTPFADAASLPPEVVSGLRRNLRSAHNTIGDGVARAFLRALVQLIGNYKEALQFREDDKKITFCRDRFVTLRPLPLQEFAEKMLQLQIFQQFIEDRLQRLNSGRQTSDEFELEVNLLGERSGSRVKQQYKQFVTSVRKDGGAIIKTMKSKTNPAVKSAVKSVTKGGKQVKEKGRQTYKEFRGKLKEQFRDDGRPTTWVNGEGVQKKPRSAPTSPTTNRRPRSVNVAPGFVVKTTYKRSAQGTPREDGRSRKYDLIESGSGLMSPASTDSLSTPSPQSLDLMGEMEEIIRARLGQGQDDDDDEDEEDYEYEDEEEEEEEEEEDGGSRSTSNSSSTSNSTRNSIKKNSTQCLPNLQTTTTTTITTTTTTATTTTTGGGDGGGSSPPPPPPPHLPPPSSSASLVSRKEDSTGQDLIFLESPQDEIFDPLLCKTLPGQTLSTTTTTTTTTTSTSSASLPRHPLHRQSLSSINASSSSSSVTSRQISSTLPSAKSSLVLGTRMDRAPLHPPAGRPPTAPPPAPYHPLSTLQTSMGTPVGCQNPLYNAHQPQGPPQPRPSTNTRAGSAAAAFASSLLAGDDTQPQPQPPSRPSPYVQFQPPLATPTPPQRQGRLTQKDLLGDFSKDFHKLSLGRGPAATTTTTTATPAAATTINTTTANNNYKKSPSVNNNNKSTDVGVKEGILTSSSATTTATTAATYSSSSSSSWTTFD